MLSEMSTSMKGSGDKKTEFIQKFQSLAENEDIGFSKLQQLQVQDPEFKRLLEEMNITFPEDETDVPDFFEAIDEEQAEKLLAYLGQ